MTYTYDDNGNLIECADHMEGGWERYTYDEDGQCIRMDYSGYLNDAYYEGNGYYEYEYDTNGNRIKESHTHQYEYEDRITTQWTSYTYNDHNQIIEENRFDEAGQLDRRIYSYDDNGNLTSDRIYANDDCVYAAEYEYNSYGQKKAEYVRATGESLSSRKKYGYDAYGNLEIEKEYDDCGELSYVKTFRYYPPTFGPLGGYLSGAHGFSSDGSRKDIYEYDYYGAYINQGNF